MKKKEFLESLKDDIQRKTGMEWDVIQVAKNQTVLDGLLAKRENGVAPVLYVNDLYQQVLGGMPFDEACTIFMERYRRVCPPELLVDDVLKDWRKRVVPDLVAIKGNREYLKDKAFNEYLDMAKIYRIQLPDGLVPDAMASVVVTNEMRKQLGVELDTLDAIAMENAQRIHPLSIQSMKSVLLSMMKSDLFPQEILQEHMDEITSQLIPNDDMFVLTNASNTNGAVAMMYPGALEQVCELMQTDELYVLPSSRHEVLCVRAEDMKPEVLLQMVKEINATQVEPEDRLTDQVYAYNTEDGLTLATDEPVMRIVF